MQDVVEPEESTTEATLDMVYDQEDAALGPDTSLYVQTPAPTVPVTEHGIVIPPEVVASMALVPDSGLNVQTFAPTVTATE